MGSNGQEGAGQAGRVWRGQKGDPFGVQAAQHQQHQPQAPDARVHATLHAPGALGEPRSALHHSMMAPTSMAASPKSGTASAIHPSASASTCGWVGREQAAAQGGARQ